MLGHKTVILKELKSYGVQLMTQQNYSELLTKRYLKNLQIFGN